MSNHIKQVYLLVYSSSKRETETTLFSSDVLVNLTKFGKRAKVPKEPLFATGRLQKTRETTATGYARMCARSFSSRTLPERRDR